MTLKKEKHSRVSTSEFLFDHLISPSQYSNNNKRKVIKQQQISKDKKIRKLLTNMFSYETINILSKRVFQN